MKPIAPPDIWKRYEETGDADYAYEVPGLARFRVNMFSQERGLGAVFRIIPTEILTLDQLRLPQSVRRLCELKSGLVLVTGPTGSGKSTTLAAMIHEINSKRAMHIITIEDPLEFVHTNQRALLTQREVGTHSKNFGAALRAAVREDPDCILVGEMRDLETISMALSAAETGLLVFGTLHTNSAAKTMDRVINVFPTDRQASVRAVLAVVTKGVLSQQLLRRKGGGRVAAVEVLFYTPALTSLIREGKTHQIGGFIGQNKARGMIGMDDSLKKLVADDLIEVSAALEKALDKDYMREWMEGQGIEVPEKEDE
jgi:twitching motility protein PilT